MSGSLSKNEIVTDQISKRSRVVRKFKRRMGFSSVRRICIACEKTVIHPNDAQYAVRVCIACVGTGGLHPPSPLRDRTSPAALGGSSKAGLNGSSGKGSRASKGGSAPSLSPAMPPLTSRGER